MEINGKWGAIDKNGIIVIKPQFDFICDFKDGLALAELDGKWGVVNKKGEFVVKPRYDDKIYYECGKYLKCSEGLMPDGVVVDERTVKTRLGLFRTEKEKISIFKFGFIDRNGNLVAKYSKNHLLLQKLLEYLYLLDYLIFSIDEYIH